MTDNQITTERLRELLNYNPETGVFVRRIRTSNSICVGDEAGFADSGYYRSGYRRITVGGQRYFAHRLAYLYMTGTWPPGDIDHANGRRDDNRWVNLRAATRSQNMANSKKSHGASGRKGVEISRCGRFVARIRCNGRRVNIGTYDTAEEASAAYAICAEMAYGEYARTT